MTYMWLCSRQFPKPLYQAREFICLCIPRWLDRLTVPMLSLSGMCCPGSYWRQRPLEMVPCVDVILPHPRSFMSATPSSTGILWTWSSSTGQIQLGYSYFRQTNNKKSSQDVRGFRMVASWPWISAFGSRPLGWERGWDHAEGQGKKFDPKDQTLRGTVPLFSLKNHAERKQFLKLVIQCSIVQCSAAN